MPDNYKAQQADSVYEALLRSAIPVSARMCYISLTGRAPSDAFIQRMRRHKILIQKMSRSPQPFDRGRGAASRLRAAMIVVFPIRWMSTTKAEVQADWPGAGSRYSLLRKKGKWTVTGRDLVWIS